MDLAVMTVGLAALIAPHLLVTRREARAAAVARLGPAGYRVLFSAVSLIGIVLIGWGFTGYRANAWIDVWYPPAWTRHVAAVLIWPAIVLVVAAYVPGHIKRVLKHPMLAGVKLWALAHLLANGDLGSIILFGAILAWAVYDRVSLNRRSDPGAPPIPVGGWKNDVAAIVAGTVVYLALAFIFHPLVIGVPAFG
jgi:uncharacterized membrane protein